MANDHTLVMPFLNDSLDFACGVEFGLLYARMQYGDEDVIDGWFISQNDEQITLAANRLGWKIKRIDYPAEGWVRVKMKRGKSSDG